MNRDKSIIISPTKISYLDELAIFFLKLNTEQIKTLNRKKFIYLFKISFQYIYSGSIK